MAKIKEAFHPNAYIQRIRNVKSGLRARSKILAILEKNSFSARSISEKTELSYGATIHHLRLLECEAIVVRKNKNPFLWICSGLGQKRLSS